TARFSVAAQTCAAGNGRGLRCRVASQPALTAQRAGAACAAYAKASATGSGCTALTTHADTPKRTRHMRPGGPVQRSTLASDQPRLTARAGAQCCIAPRAGESADVAGTGQLAAGGD